MPYGEVKSFLFSSSTPHAAKDFILTHCASFSCSVRKPQLLCTDVWASLSFLFCLVLKTHFLEATAQSVAKDPLADPHFYAGETYSLLMALWLLFPHFLDHFLHYRLQWPNEGPNSGCPFTSSVSIKWNGIINWIHAHSWNCHPPPFWFVCFFPLIYFLYEETPKSPHAVSDFFSLVWLIYKTRLTEWALISDKWIY